jgi:hypothetical protein
MLSKYDPFDPLSQWACAAAFLSLSCAAPTREIRAPVGKKYYFAYGAHILFYFIHVYICLIQLWLFEIIYLSSALVFSFHTIKRMLIFFILLVLIALGPSYVQILATPPTCRALSAFIESRTPPWPTSREGGSRDGGVSGVAEPEGEADSCDS